VNKNLRWKVLVILAVVGLSVWSFYPPGTKVNLGLDLKGGVHMVLKVRTDDGLRAETETVVERLRDTLTRGASIELRFGALEQERPAHSAPAFRVHAAIGSRFRHGVHDAAVCASLRRTDWNSVVRRCGSVFGSNSAATNASAAAAVRYHAGASA